MEKLAEICFWIVVLGITGGFVYWAFIRPHYTTVRWASFGDTDFQVSVSDKKQQNYELTQTGIKKPLLSGSYGFRLDEDPHHDSRALFVDRESRDRESLYLLNRDGMSKALTAAYRIPTTFVVGNGNTLFDRTYATTVMRVQAPQSSYVIRLFDIYRKECVLTKSMDEAGKFMPFGVDIPLVLLTTYSEIPRYLMAIHDEACFIDAVRQGITEFMYIGISGNSYYVAGISADKIKLFTLTPGGPRRVIELPGVTGALRIVRYLNRGESLKTRFLVEDTSHPEPNRYGVLELQFSLSGTEGSLTLLHAPEYKTIVPDGATFEALKDGEKSKTKKIVEEA